MYDRAHHAPLFRFDAGWLYLIAGSALIVATVLIPAVNDLTEARWHRDRCLALERFRSDRLKNYTDYLDALDSRSPTLVLALAATQLNLAPADKRPLFDDPEPRSADASVFRDLDPTLRMPPAPKEPGSLLQKWATHEGTRMWLIVGGAVSLMIGLMPASEPGSSSTGKMVGFVRALFRRRNLIELPPMPDETADTVASPDSTVPAPEKKPHTLRLVGSSAA